MASGAFPHGSLPTGELTTVGKAETSLDKVAAPARLTLAVSLDGTTIANDWNFWVYPTQVDAVPGDVTVASAWNDEIRVALTEGKRVLLSPSRATFSKTVKSSLKTVFWSPVWCPEQSDGTMGILCNPKHPALARFPTDMHTNWQWNEPISHSVTMVLDDLPAELRPIVQVVDNFTKNRRLGLVFEARVGKGKLLVSSIDLIEDMNTRPVSRQMLASLLAYMQSDAFQPEVNLDVESMSRLMSLSKSEVVR